ncbi:MAG: glycosyltransferase [Candidatus Saccharibacteria bacterium]|nr:glycosyltransferase [Candidatus Saccharibacteria bacterium]
MDSKTLLKNRTSKFIIIGTILALFNFLIYTFLAHIVFNNNDLLWLDSMISYVLATFLAYLLHSRVTWRERSPTKKGIFMFFLWNFLTALIISPLFTWLFGFLTPLYEFTHHLINFLPLSLEYDFVESTGIFVLTTLVTMILNYLFYDKLVFGSSQKNHVTSAPLMRSNPPLEKNPKVSIIIPIYNTSKYLSKCLDRVINQTYHNLEIILIDDGSTDGSAQIINSYAKKDSRIKVIHQKNSGQSAARNAGLKIATGDYLNFIDSDDVVAKTFIEELLKPYLKNLNTSLTVCGLRYNWLKTKTFKDVYINNLRPRKKTESNKAYILYLLAIDGRLYSSVNKLYKKEYLNNLVFDKTLNFAEDTKFVLDYLNNTPNDSNISFIPKALYHYNYGTETSTMKKTATIWKNWQTSYRNLKNWLGKTPTIREKFWLHLVYLRWRISYIRSKHRTN